MGGLYHGRILLHWCDSCHTPVLAEHCACGAATRAVPVTPPGDARPAFPEDIAFVNSIYEEQFGMSIIPEGQIALMNKVPDHDRMEEIIVGGAIVGAIRYLPGERRWEALPRPDAALIAQPKKRFMVIDEGALSSIREGRSLLAPGLISCDSSIREGDEVFIMTPSGICAGVGRARVDAEEANRMERGQVVKTRKNIPSVYTPGEAPGMMSYRQMLTCSKKLKQHLENSSRTASARMSISLCLSHIRVGKTVLQHYLS